MSSPGWYPDPSADAGAQRWRWFDGSSWTAATAVGVDAPPQPPESVTGRAPKPGRTVRSSAPWLVLVTALVVGGVLFSLLQWRAPRPSYIPTPGPPAASAAPSEPSRPPSECPVGVSAFRTSHPDDGFTYGGRLALPKTAVPYDSGPLGGIPVLAALEDTQTWFVSWQSGNRRQSGLTLGELRRTGYYLTPKDAARRAAACMASAAVRGADVTGQVTVTDTQVTVGGRPGWQVAIDVTLNPAKQLGVTGERLIVVVVDDGRDDWMSALAVTVRLDRPELVSKVDRLVASLQLVTG